MVHVCPSPGWEVVSVVPYVVTEVPLLLRHRCATFGEVFDSGGWVVWVRSFV